MITRRTLTMSKPVEIKNPLCAMPLLFFFLVGGSCHVGAVGDVFALALVDDIGTNGAQGKRTSGILKIRMKFPTYLLGRC